MKIPEAFDLTGGLRAAAQLAGCDHTTVAHYVALGDAGQGPDELVRRSMTVDPYLAKVEEWVDSPSNAGRRPLTTLTESLI